MLYFIVVKLITIVIKIENQPGCAVRTRSVAGIVSTNILDIFGVTINVCFKFKLISVLLKSISKQKILRKVATNQ
ncbi:MAG: hypothetical protein EAZ15_03520 [Sphingobacteriales bacterium]|nr:MAG: hypothetical protein EAZ15_03520 [Sphingobacteriales bacterium]